MLFWRFRLRVAWILCALIGASCVIHTTHPDDQRPNRHHKKKRPRGHRPPPPPAAAHHRRPTPPAPPDQAPKRAEPPARATVPSQPPKEEAPHTRTAPALLRPGVGAGRPRGFRPGAPAAFWIWQGPRGGWRLKTTTKQMAHLFRGHLRGTTGGINQVHPSRTEFRDRIWKTKQGWAFSFKTLGHADGFTFVISDNGCVRFDLQLDGGPHPKKIFIGKREIQPPSNHFIVCPKGATPKSAR